MNIKKLLIERKVTSKDLLFYWELEKNFPSGVIDVSRAKIAKKVKVCKATMVHNYLERLVEAGLLVQTGKKGLSNVYQFTERG